MSAEPRRRARRTAAASGDAAGQLALVLHTHMPYVEGFGTWPFGEEWLWEAIATSYMPLLAVLDELGPQRARAALTLSLTPVLADQLEAPGAIERCVAFIREVRLETHRRDRDAARRDGDEAAATELERSAADYAEAADALERMHASGSSTALLEALGAHATWTSAATHAILPLLALRESLDVQLGIGIESHRRRFGEWGGGLWLPECAHAPWLDADLSEHAVRLACVELTGLLGRGDELHLTPIQSGDGPVLVPLDRQTIDLVWAGDGYPARAAYRNHHAFTPHHHRVRANDGSPYDRARAAAQAEADARDFVAAVRRRVAGGGLCVCGLDTELLGHWWFEGPQWLRAVLAEADAQGLALTTLDERALARHPPRHAELDTITSWGAGNDLRTWSGPAVAELARTARTAELRAFAATPSPRTLRELLALQSSDWAFMVSRGWAADYPRQRASGHAAQLQRSLAGDRDEPRLRNLAPDL